MQPDPTLNTVCVLTALHFQINFLSEKPRYIIAARCFLRDTPDFAMIELKTQLVLAFAWIVLCFTVGKCSVYPNSTYIQECERQCHKPPKDSRVSEVRFSESVLNLF